MSKTILVLAANPKDTPRLRLDEEVREIDNGLQRARRRDEFVLKQVWAARPIDVRRAMLDLKPSIVHFCGHGGGEQGIAFEDETGNTKLVSADALTGFFELFADKVECVVLNACYSETQAEAIAQHINHVIGMKKGVGDTAAIEFAVAFYDALGSGESIEFAYRLACNAIRWANGPEHLTPILKSRIHSTEQPDSQVASSVSEVNTRRFDRPSEDCSDMLLRISQDTGISLDAAQPLPADHPGLESLDHPRTVHPVLCLLNEAIIFVHPEKRSYSMQFTHVLKNIGRDPITQVPCPFYANAYPDDPRRCLEWYSVNKISWEELKFRALDDFGPLDVELRSDFNAAKDIVAFFSEHGVDRPIYSGEVRTFRRRFVISFPLWGPYIDRAVRDPTDMLCVKIVAPVTLRGFRVGGKELSRTGPVAPLQTPPRRTLLGAKQVWTWEQRAPKFDSTYRLSWPVI